MRKALCLTQQTEAAWEGSRGYVDGDCAGSEEHDTGRVGWVCSVVTLSRQSCVTTRACCVECWPLILRDMVLCVLPLYSLPRPPVLYCSKHLVVCHSSVQKSGWWELSEQGSLEPALLHPAEQRSSERRSALGTGFLGCHQGLPWAFNRQWIDNSFCFCFEQATCVKRDVLLWEKHGQSF